MDIPKGSLWRGYGELLSLSKKLKRTYYAKCTFSMSFQHKYVSPMCLKTPKIWTPPCRKLSGTGSNVILWNVLILLFQNSHSNSDYLTGRYFCIGNCFFITPPPHIWHLSGTTDVWIISNGWRRISGLLYPFWMTQAMFSLLKISVRNNIIARRKNNPPLFWKQFPLLS